MTMRSVGAAGITIGCMLLAGLAEPCAAQVNWTAQWIAAAPDVAPAAQDAQTQAPLPIVRSTFEVPKKLASSTLIRLTSSRPRHSVSKRMEAVTVLACSTGSAP